MTTGLTTAPIWLLLFMLVQSADAFTTAIDRSRGAIEAMPVSSQVISEGGVIVFWILKLSLVIAFGGALLLAARWVGRGRPGAVVVYRFVILGVQLTTSVLAIVSLQNAVLRTGL